MQHQGLVKTTPLPTRDTDIHASYIAHIEMIPIVRKILDMPLARANAPAGRLVSAEGRC